MMKYTVHDNFNVAIGGPDATHSADDKEGTVFKHLLGTRDQRLRSTGTYSENTDCSAMPGVNIQGAFHALGQLMLCRQESKQCAEEIIKIFTELLQVDGACLYQCTADGTHELLACSATWSTIISTLRSVEEIDDQNILLHPPVLLPCPSGVNGRETDQSSKSVPLSLITRNYGSIISLPLVCDETTIGTISLFSSHPQFFLPDRIDVLRTAANLTASLFVNIQTRNSLEKEQIERITLQTDIQLLREKIASNQSPADTRVAAEAAYNELEALSYSVSHDLRGPILAIKNNCDWLHTQHAANLDTEGHVLLEQIMTSSEHMEKLLDGLLEFSRVVQLNPGQTLIDMTALVRTVIDDLLKNESGSTALSIAVRPLLPAYGDATLLRQVWQNLLSNALKYTRYKQQREVTIDSHPFNGGAKYCVSDNGIGFDMQYVDRLFGAFHRLHIAEEFEGTGVGLAIVQRIVRRHGGQVWAEGKVDQGAQFYFTLPKTEKPLKETTGILQ